MKIGNNNDPGNTGKLHVDYAQARDDQYEYECRQRQLQREVSSANSDLTAERQFSETNFKLWNQFSATA